MFKTKNDLSEGTRAKVVELLNARLADCIDLQTQTKQAHWNVKGPNFIALHELFDKINEEVEDNVDDIAERAVQLGGVAEGTARMVAKRSSLADQEKVSGIIVFPRPFWLSTDGPLGVHATPSPDVSTSAAATIPPRTAWRDGKPAVKNNRANPAKTMTPDPFSSPVWQAGRGG
jgi:hypothetical protein